MSRMHLSTLTVPCENVEVGLAMAQRAVGKVREVDSGIWHFVNHRNLESQEKLTGSFRSGLPEGEILGSEVGAVDRGEEGIDEVVSSTI